MTKYVLKRLLYMVIVFLLVSLLMYSIYNLIPTDTNRPVACGIFSGSFSL